MATPRRAISASSSPTCSTSLRRQALGRLVDQDQVGIAHQRAAHRQHLLLAAGQHAGGVVLALAQVGKQPEHVVERPATELSGPLQAELQVLPHRQRRKDLPVLRHVADAEMRDLIGPQPDDVAAAIADRALRAGPDP